MQAFYQGAWCKRLLCGGAFWAASAKHASRHGRGLAFELYLNRDAGILSGGVVQGQYRLVRAGVSCAAVRSGPHVLSTHRDMVAFI
jgi:hypothetical protein